jgi:hypothetical protein
MKHSGVEKLCVKKRAYYDEYIKFGFSPTYAGNKNYLILRCMCDDVIMNSSLKPFFFGGT